MVYRLKRETKFSDLKFTINGGIETYDQIAQHLDNGVDGVMLGRVVYKGSIPALPQRGCNKTHACGRSMVTHSNGLSILRQNESWPFAA